MLGEIGYSGVFVLMVKEVKELEIGVGDGLFHSRIDEMSLEHGA